MQWRNDPALDYSKQEPTNGGSRLCDVSDLNGTKKPEPALGRLLRSRASTLLYIPAPITQEQRHPASELTMPERPREPEPDDPSVPPPDPPDPPPDVPDLFPWLDRMMLPVDTIKMPIRARTDTAPAATVPGFST